METDELVMLYMFQMMVAMIRTLLSRCTSLRSFTSTGQLTTDKDIPKRVDWGALMRWRTAPVP
jgi:uncharacterized protein YceK